MRRLAIATCLLVAGCPPSPPAGVPNLEGTLRLSLDPDRPLARGETVTLRAKVVNEAVLSGTGVLILATEAGLTRSSGEPGVTAPLPAGGTLEATWTIQVPDDDRARRLKVFAELHTATAGTEAIQRLIEANPIGGLHDDAASHHDLTGPIAVALDTSARLRRGTDVTLTLTATAQRAHPRFELSLLLPPEVTLLSGTTRLDPRPAVVGDILSLGAVVHVGDTAADSIVIGGMGRFGQPTDPDFAGGSTVAVRDTP